MESIKRSESAKGLVTIAINNFLDVPESKVDESYNRFLDTASLEILDYSTNERTYHPNGLITIFQDTYSSKMASVLGSYIRFLPDSLETLLGFALNKVAKLEMENIATMIRENRWDILLLLNGKGLPVDLVLFIDAFMHEQHGETNVTTLATTQAKSGMCMLFCTGSRRIAMPSTEFLLHDVLNNDGHSVSGQMDATLQNYLTQKRYDVIQDTNELVRGGLKDKLLAQWDSENNHDHAIQWLGNESPGFIDQYLDQQLPVPHQLEQIVGRQIDPALYQSDVVARYAMESEAERILRGMGLNIRIHTAKDSFIISGLTNKSEGGKCQEVISQVLSSSSRYTAELKE